MAAPVPGAKKDNTGAGGSLTSWGGSGDYFG